MKVRTTNALMKYLREKHNISIEGTKDKKNLKKSPYRLEKGSSSVTVSTDVVIIRADKITISPQEQA